ncbi:hypothetical protein EZS27_000838 [termite gut metagenome]|uniref:Uncharacterized protein n=1 Tax=termite gut metagenome TaxID=433724 RepID=A0A5J4T0B9_9ZZZZ
MEEPLNSNIQVIVDLLMVELAESKSRFVDPLINGVFYLCEMSS